MVSYYLKSPGHKVKTWRIRFNPGNKTRAQHVSDTWFSGVKLVPFTCQITCQTRDFVNSISRDEDVILITCQNHVFTTWKSREITCLTRENHVKSRAKHVIVTSPVHHQFHTWIHVSNTCLVSREDRFESHEFIMCKTRVRNHVIFMWNVVNKITC